MSLFRIILLLVFYADCVNSARIKNNGYEEVSVSFSGKAQQHSIDFDKLKSVLKNASTLLYHTTRRRSYIKEFVVVVPPKWTEDSVCEQYVDSAPRKIDIYVTDTSEVPTAKPQHSRKCGEEGDIIYLTVDWLKGNIEDLARHFVQMWSTFRYGVFSEDPERSGSCVMNSDSSWSPAGCYNAKLDDVEPNFDENGLPVCYLPDGFNEMENLSSSFMFSRNYSKVLNFCDGSLRFPHNPVAPTLHNRICSGKPVWSVIKNTEDFVYGRNLPMKEINPPTNPVFNCFRDSNTQVILGIQNGSSTYIIEEIREIKYTLLHFLWNMAPSDSTVNLIMFSNADLTGEAKPLELNLEAKDKLSAALDSYVHQYKTVSSICFICGLQKIFNVSAANHHPPTTVVMIAYESSLEDTKIPDLIELIQKHSKITLYLIFVEDTDTNIVQRDLVKAVESTAGRIHRIRNTTVFMIPQLNIALLEAFKNVLHIEDKTMVIYKKVYENETSDITDTFQTPKGTMGRILYTIICSNLGAIRITNANCSDWDQESFTYKCKQEMDLNSDTVQIWKFHYKYQAGNKPITCSSLAMLKLDSPSLDLLTVRGWLSENEITPGRNVLVIYAEVLGVKEQNVRVEARISGPGLDNYELELRDNGNGDPDIIKGDNIYSRYFTSIKGKGTYVVDILIESDTSERKDIYRGQKSKADELKFTRTKVIGTFTVTQPPPDEDILPPSRVADLSVASIDNQKCTVFLTWTAPGDDYDFGRAFKYMIKFSKHWMNLLDFTFYEERNNLLKLLDEYLPANSGFPENLLFQHPKEYYNGTYYVALRAIDENNNEAKVSNIVQIYIQEYENSLNSNLTTSSETTNLTSSTIIFSSTDNNNNFTTKSPEETNFTSPASTTISKNVTDIIDRATKEGLFIERKYVIIIFSTTGAVILLLIIVNITVCLCCFRKNKSKKPKKLSRKASLRPPYNLNIAYKHGSESSLDMKDEGANSMSTLADENSYSQQDRKKMHSQNRYTYHTNKTLMREDGNSRKNDLGFKFVQAMPAYATTSLSRFETSTNFDEESESSNAKSISNIQKLPSDDKTEIYSLGVI